MDTCGSLPITAPTPLQTINPCMHAYPTQPVIVNRMCEHLLRCDLEQRVDRFPPGQFMMGMIPGMPELMWGTTALQLAVALGSEAASELLLRYGADAHAPAPPASTAAGGAGGGSEGCGAGRGGFLETVLGKARTAFCRLGERPGMPPCMSLSRLREIIGTKRDSEETAAVPARLHMGTCVLLQVITVRLAGQGWEGPEEAGDGAGRTGSIAVP